MPQALNLSNNKNTFSQDAPPTPFCTLTVRGFTKTLQAVSRGTQTDTESEEMCGEREKKRETGKERE